MFNRSYLNFNYLLSEDLPPSTSTHSNNTTDMTSRPDLPSATINHLSINPDQGCFAVALDTGFRAYNCDAFRQTMRRDFDTCGGIGLLSLLFRTSLVFLVGGGAQPRYPPNRVMIWDDQQNSFIGELSLRSEVKNVKLRRDRIIVVFLLKISVYNMSNLKVLDEIETIENPKGLCEVSQTVTPMVLVCPGLLKGQVRVENYACKRRKFIMAHASQIACLAMTLDGRFLATASSKGTLIRVFNTMDGSLLQEVRRGADRADIYSLAFSSNVKWLAASSDKGTVHVFNLKFDSPSLGSSSTLMSQPNLSNKSSPISTLPFFKGVLPKYFSSEWSVAQFRLREGVRYLVAFGREKNTVIIIGMDGSYYKCQFDPNEGGEMTQLEHFNFLKPEEEAS
ncbi:hypothetical protein Dsin_023569 [Dipteronia sinensis]|uniref:Autophagy-related protein 18a n=1 Tax=Dipteronia sinensis TaxID=43782 RepID=A0AAE0E165_9ROSI|nr:hypothetical protein Dsin_023569 [Dipteronia sinensis]